MSKKLVFYNKIFDFAKNLGQFFVFSIVKMGEHKISIANLTAKAVISCANAKTWKIVRAEMGYERLKAIIATGATPLAETDLAEFKVKIVANYEKILRFELIKIHNGANALANFVVVILSFDKQKIAFFVFRNKSVEFRFILPFEFVDFGIKIQRQKA